MAETNKIKIGIIGSLGLVDPDIIGNLSEIQRKNRYGYPSHNLVVGEIENVDCVILARHERRYTFTPTNVNYRANIWGLYERGCTHIITVNTVGSLREEIKPGDLVFPDQFIDRTTSRPSTFYDGGPDSLEGVCHIPMHDSYCADTRQILIDIAKELKYDFHETATIINVEGPSFPGKAEINLFRSWGCDIIGMTTVPEVCLANELGLCFATIALVVDYDTDESGVDDLLDKLTEYAYKTNEILLKAIPVIAEKDWCSILEEKSKIARDAVISSEKQM